MMEVMGQPRQRFLTATDKCRKSLVGTTELIFCSDYKAPTLFQNLQKMSLTCRERCTLQTCYQLWYTIRVSVLQPNNPPSRRMSYPPSEDILSSNVGLRLGNLHQYPYI